MSTDSADAVDDDNLLALVRECFDASQIRSLTRVAWKDGIDIDEPSYALRRFAAALLEAERGAADMIAEERDAWQKRAEAEQAKVAQLERELAAAREARDAECERVLTAERKLLVAQEALGAILREPSRPWPDPVAHSLDAYARAIHASWCAMRFIAINALDRAREEKP